MEDVLDDYDSEGILLGNYKLRTTKLLIAELVIFLTGFVIAALAGFNLYALWKQNEMDVRLFPVLTLWFVASVPFIFAIQWHYYSKQIDKGVAAIDALDRTRLDFFWGFSWLLLLPCSFVLFMFGISWGTTLISGYLGPEHFRILLGIIALIAHIYYLLETSSRTNAIKLLKTKESINGDIGRLSTTGDRGARA